MSGTADVPDLRFWRQAYARELREISAIMEQLASELDDGVGEVAASSTVSASWR